jgi:hypothetical protein
VSYISYQPTLETSLPSAADPTPKRRWTLKGVLIALICLGPPTAYYLWRFWPRTPAAPLAMIELPNGNQLRIVGYHAGRELKIRSDETFGGRVLWDRYWHGFRAPPLTRQSESTVWLIVSEYNPRMRRFWAPSMSSFEVVENPGPGRFPGDASLSNYGAGPPVTPLAFDVIPRRSPQLQIRFISHGQTVTAAIANPFYNPSAPSFQAEPLPQVREVEGVRIELQRFRVSTTQTSINGGPVTQILCDPLLTVTMPGVPNAPFQISRELIDPTGNRIADGALPTGDRVWGLRVNVTEGRDFPFPPERAQFLGKFKVPGPGQAVALTVPPRLAAAGVNEIFFCGVGQFSWRGGTLSGTAPGGGKPAVISKISHRYSNSQGFTVPTLMILGRNHDAFEQVGAFLRFRSGEERLDPNSSGTSSYNEEVTITRSHFSMRGGKTYRPLAVGDEMEIEVIIPKIRTVEFYFERPKLPGE